MNLQFTIGKKKPVKKYAEGGMLEGPSHEQGGMPIMDSQTGEAVAEVEGGERIFSVESSKMMEQMTTAFMEAEQSGDPQAQEILLQLGQLVVQEMINQDQSMADQEAEAANQMDTGDGVGMEEPYMDIPQGRMGLKFKR